MKQRRPRNKKGPVVEKHPTYGTDIVLEKAETPTTARPTFSQFVAELQKRNEQ